MTTDADHDASIASALRDGRGFREQIIWQMEHETWRVKGHASWGEFFRATYAGLRLEIARDDRPQLEVEMRRRGHTQEDIATTLGVSEATVRSDLNRRTAVDDQPQTITTARGERPARYTVADVVEADGHVADLRYLASFTQALRALTRVVEFDADRLGDLASPEDVALYQSLVAALERHRDQVQRRHSTLRVVGR